MQFPISMMHDNIWTDRLNYIEAEEYIHLPKTSDGQVVSSGSVSSSLVDEISNMRASIKTCVSGISTTTDSSHVAKLEAGSPAAPSAKAEEKADDDDDFDIFGDEDEE